MNLQINFESGGANVLDRVLIAYGFTTKIALCDHLGIASSSLANRYKRDFFPSDIVVRCIAETGARLKWLVTGEGEIFESGKDEQAEALPDSLLNVSHSFLVDGQLKKDSDLKIDSKFFSISTTSKNLHLVTENKLQHVINKDAADLRDGKWLVEIEGATSIKTLTRIPVGRVRVQGEGTDFECKIVDIKPLGHVIMTCYQ